ncbi:MAG: 50S ribosomal protein L5 [Candidatus Spechtbacteria bacterium SB0662_bin_43]|uniref:50S ribosomal protein L5 n=1 Tax=Candidatus Spechtbacteria bacterium SB0662_bin_43 TaxID=2604897 RepID=A0A845D9W0_9BACT|nr:50S ribosomal protein L5 [Candidatus Spechtbacteria bacterium SB0662_bin_43]
MALLNLEKTYKEEIRPKLIKQTKGKSNVHAVVRLEKAIVNVGVGKVASTRRASASSKKTEEELVEDIATMVQGMSGQKPKVVIARKSIAGFKLREGNVAGLTATVRGQRMYDLVGRLVHIALPRTRDFRGIPLTSVDKDGNITIGVRDMTIFPELANTISSFGCEITLVTSTKNREQAIALYRELGIPFVKENT